MTFVSHDLLGKTVSRLDDGAFRQWPSEFGDCTEATIIAVWIEPVRQAAVDSDLRYAIKNQHGRVACVPANRVRLGSYVGVPSVVIRCPRCSFGLGPTRSMAPASYDCPRCDSIFEWPPSS